jgi:glycosyltransferase domain-containing protein
MKSELKDLTLIIPSYNRHDFIKEQFDFWLDYQVELLILDGSETPLEMEEFKELPDRYQYVHSEKSFISRLANHSDKIRTKYSAILFDDEKFYPESLIKAINILNRNPRVYSVSGQVLGFKNLGMDIYLLNMYSEFANANLKNKNAEDRIKQHLNPYRMTTLCAVSRVATLQKSLKAIKHFEFIPVPTIFEICFEIVSASHGESIVVQNIFWMRNCNNQPQWDQNPKRSLVEWWKQGGSEEYFSKLRRILDKEKNPENKKILCLIDFGLKEFIRLEEKKVRNDLGTIKSVLKKTKSYFRIFVLYLISEKNILDLKIIFRKYIRLKRKKFKNWGSLDEIVSENVDEDSLKFHDFLTKINHNYNCRLSHNS